MFKMALRSVLLCCVVLGFHSEARARQSSHWAEGFDGGVFSRASTLIVHDAGAGPELHAFGLEPKVLTPQVCRFDGSLWRLSAPPDNQVWGAANFDTGSGPELVAATNAPPVLRFANGAWTNIATVYLPPQSPNTTNSGVTLPVVAWDDGSGPAVYVGGAFITVGSTAANNIARWDGTNWSALGSGLDGTVTALTVYDDGSGPALYAAGAFYNAGGSPAAGFARWRNGVWSAVAGSSYGSYSALEAFDDGTGTKLYAGGTFGNVHLAAWDGSSWTNLPTPAAVTALAVHDDGGGPALFVAHLPYVSQNLPGGLLCLRGGTWTTLPLLHVSAVYSMTTFQGRLWIAGDFSWAGGMPGPLGWAGPDGFSNVQAWDGTTFHSAFTGNGTNGDVYGARILDTGNGPRLYAGGSFRRAGHTPASNVASFDGTTWSSLGAGASSSVYAFEAFDDGSGMKLYVGGAFTSPGGLVASWNGASWAPLGSGLAGSYTPSLVEALQSFDDGSGPKLYVGGKFEAAGGSPVANIARWNGSTWSPVGNGFGIGGFPSGSVKSFAVFDEGAGPRLFAGGQFMQSGTTTVLGVARWDGTSWTAVGGGIQAGSGDGVHALCVHDDGSGPKLYAAGGYVVPAGNVARWDGATWTSVGAGLPQIVDSLCVHDDGSGPKLYAGILSVSGTSSSGIYRWDGSSWAVVAGAPSVRINEAVTALASFDDPSSDPAALYAFGWFQGNETVSSNVAKWSTASEDVLVCFGDGSGTACPCGNASTGAQAAGCLNSFGFAGTLRTSGAASVSSDTLALLGASMANNGAALYFQGTTAIGLGSGAVFGDGLRCAGGSVRRLATVANSSGASHVPDVAHPTPLSITGSIPAGGATRVYQAWYRNSASFCTPATFNLTNGVRTTWRP